MKMRVTPFRAEGSLRAQPSKSAAHRLLICAALSDRETEIVLPSMNADMEATAACLSALGARFQRAGECVRVIPVAEKIPCPHLNCGESGSTLRFLLPVAAALSGASFTGRGRLPQRPLSDLTEELTAHGVSVSGDRLPLQVSGGLLGGRFSLPGGVSSQYFTGLMLAAPLIGETVIDIRGRLESAAYIAMTREAMRLFGVKTEMTEDRITVFGGQRYVSPGRAVAEGDWSGAAFPLALGALAGRVQVLGLQADSAQGDKRIVPLLQRMGAKVSQDESSVTVERADRLTALTQDVSGIPDMVPALAALLMHAEGTSCLQNAGRLRLKESDRLESVCAMVNSLGGRARIEGDSLVIEGSDHCAGGAVDGYGDHRIVMAALAGASRCLGPSEISGAEAVQKSYPSFWDDITALGGTIDVVGIRE